MNKKNLTEAQIAGIIRILHANMQFYSATGEEANGQVLDELGKVLEEHPLAEGD